MKHYVGKDTYILDCVKPGYKDDDLIAQLYEFTQKNITPSVTPLWENYSRKRLDIEGHLIFSVLMKDQEIISFCGIYNNGRYPKGVYRVLNRKFNNPEYRKWGMLTHNMKWRSFDLVNYQINQVRDELDAVFVSFEKLSRKKILPELTKQIGVLSEYKWEFPDGFFKVAPCEGPTCYQSIAWCDLSNKFNEIPLKKISGEDYRNRFKVV